VPQNTLCKKSGKAFHEHFPHNHAENDPFRESWKKPAPYNTPAKSVPCFHECPKCPNFPHGYAENTHGKIFHESSMFSMNCGMQVPAFLSLLCFEEESMARGVERSELIECARPLRKVAAGTAGNKVIGFIAAASAHRYQVINLEVAERIGLPPAVPALPPSAIPGCSPASPCTAIGGIFTNLHGVLARPSDSHRREGDRLTAVKQFDHQIAGHTNNASGLHAGKHVVVIGGCPTRIGNALHQAVALDRLAFLQQDRSNALFKSLMNANVSRFNHLPSNSPVVSE